MLLFLCNRKQSKVTTLSESCFFAVDSGSSIKSTNAIISAPPHLPAMYRESALLEYYESQNTNNPRER